MASPNRGPAGTQIKIVGEHLDHAVVIIDGKRWPGHPASSDREVAFAIPADLTVGAHKIQLEYEHKVIDAGMFDVTAANGNGGIVPPNMGHGPVRWNFDRPAILGFGPAKGEPGDKIIVRGKNLTPDIQVVWNDQVIPATVRAADGEIGFQIPKGATTAAVYLRGGKLRRDLAVGTIEVAKYDRNEWKHHDDERRAAAEAAWKARSDKFAKDRAARDAELARQQAELDKSRDERRRAYLAEVAAKFQAAFLADPETQEELALHAKHVAELGRMQRIAADLADQKLGVRIEIAERKENERHDTRMAALKAAFKG
jgi:hypothetical protein